MTTDKLTDATNVTLESATYENLTDDYTDDRTDEVEVSRWSKKGDRLYINGPAKYEKNSTYFDLVAGEMQDLPGSRDVTVERDGDTVTINVADTGGLGYDEEWTFVLELEFPADDDEDDEKSITFDEIEEIEEGDQFTDGETTISVVEVEGASNPAKTEITYDNGVTQPGEELHAAINKHGSIWPVETDGEDQDGPEIVADGGEDVTDHVDDETIEGTIAQHDDPDHPEATTVEEARDALAWLQMSIEEHWRDWLSNVENNESTVVYEDREVIVFATGEQNIPRRDLRQHYDGASASGCPMSSVPSTTRWRASDAITIGDTSTRSWSVSPQDLRTDSNTSSRSSTDSSREDSRPVKRGRTMASRSAGTRGIVGASERATTITKTSLTHSRKRGESCCDAFT